MDITRGAVVIVSARGAYTGKPRPALVVQADSFTPTHAVEDALRNWLGL